MATTARQRRQWRDAQRSSADRAGRRLCAEEGTVAIFQQALCALVDADFLTRTGYRLLFGLIGLMEPGNYVYYSVAGIARQLGMGYTNTLRQWHVLEARGVLLREYNMYGSLTCYRLSPALCWRGRPWKAKIVQANLVAARQLERLAHQYEET